jgi:hypothetical protein
MTSIRAGGPAASGSVQGASLGGAMSSGALARAVMNDVAGKMAGSISSALDLTNAEGTDQWQGNGSDPYNVDEMVASLADELGGSASDVGNLSRALHDFIQNSAALFAARPESRSLAILNSIISVKAEPDGAASLASIATHIDAATSDLRATEA